MLAFRCPVVTVCTGHAYPMGAFLMLAADVRFGVAGSFRIGMNEVAIALTVPSFALEIARHRLTPAGFARITTAAMFGPDEALRHGYLDYVVDPAQLDTVVELDRPAFVATKSRINAHALEAIRAAIGAELA